MSDSTIATYLWVFTGIIWIGLWRACARLGIRTGATLQRAAGEAARLAANRPPSDVLVDDSIPRSGRAAIILGAVLVAYIYGTQTTPDLDPIRIWWEIGPAVGTAGIVGCIWQGIGVGRRRQAVLDAKR